VKARSHKQGSRVIVYDADCIEQPGSELFDPGHWQRQGAVVAEAPGRGSALLLETPFGPAVLRQYLRGGQAARLSRDCYLFTGYRRSRPLAEFRMLARLAAAGLPVPAPLAAICIRAGLCYRGWLLTRRIMTAQPLADLLGAGNGSGQIWPRIGAAIRRFHDRGVVHADLNARNILVGDEQQVYLIDFDRARVSAGDRRAFAANLRRLRRSLDKLWPSADRGAVARCWAALLEGYRSGAGP
jgi:3-deoxy-D-manno-octulosonic acid kinase